ncbi:MAG: VF530 family protein [Thalassotalea sp.]|nr:VF530 family protein [Thalassotalea sp.]MDG2392809.1 VF530 family protein [Thalassotalea sp.]
MNNDPLHGVKLEDILVQLEKKLGWAKMGELLNIKCFINNPRLKSSLTFLRKTEWARKKVEILYLKTFFKNHPATKGLILNFIEQKNNTGGPGPKKPEAFKWPKQ